ncbi:hypothetical protein PILCRDRAFT_811325 [Piloderma croceum F 1598]|uniref:Uncharacterized protein n=1 Tax=Piloderma croceum (strain F 1598) TaxID=765440 RepID=A0A0C3CME4_PILCF|nr:hypothetical protein PILCRDRAFT_811325 [Piloderma croceum F 1598]
MARPYSPPPPPYESSQQEFDRKTAQALEASLSPNLHPHLYAEQDNSWENYDEAAFEAAHEAAAMTESRGGSSSTWSSTHSFKSPSTEKWAVPISSSMQPLRVHEPTPSESKERPSWLAEAHFAESSTFQPLSSRSTPYGDNSGPQSEPPERPLVMIAYHDNGSAPPSPLSPPPPLIVHSPYPSRPPSRLILPLSSSPQPNHRVLSHSPQPYSHQPLSPPARQVTGSAHTVETPSQPHMVFDHTVAYTKRDDGVVSPMESRPYNAAEFYNSAVSSHLPTSPSKSSPLSHMPQSQHHSHQSIRGTLPNISPTHPVPSFPPYASRSPSAQLPIPSRSNPGNAHARWATSEEQIGRDF